MEGLLGRIVLWWRDRKAWIRLLVCRRGGASRRCVPRRSLGTSGSVRLGVGSLASLYSSFPGSAWERTVRQDPPAGSGGSPSVGDRAIEPCTANERRPSNGSPAHKGPVHLGQSLAMQKSINGGKRRRIPRFPVRRRGGASRWCVPRRSLGTSGSVRLGVGSLASLGYRPPPSSCTSVGNLDIMARLAFSRKPSPSVRPALAPSVTAARRLRTSRTSPILIAVTPASSRGS